jgi:hypothetical protein
MNCSFIEHFSSLTDPRIERKKLHMLIDILVLTVYATLSGTEGGKRLKNLGTANWIGCAALYR